MNTRNVRNIRKEENAIVMKHNKLIVASKNVLKKKKKQRKQTFVNIPLNKKNSQPQKVSRINKRYRVEQNISNKKTRSIFFFK